MEQESLVCSDVQYRKGYIGEPDVIYCSEIQGMQKLFLFEFN